MTAEPKSELSPELAAINEAEPRDALNEILKHALAKSASDLFILSNATHYVVSIRRLGAIEQVVVLSPSQGIQIVHLVKSNAGMDLSERRHPVDGRWSHEVDGTTVDFRVNSIGTLHGEDMVLRILPTSDKRLSIDGLGLVGNQVGQLRAMLSSGSGLILVTGPVGAGKSTTLYACLEHLNNGRRMINTLEDPIEHVLSGLRQCQVQPKIGLGFTEMLRGIMRQSPDVIMIGEIRDEETAKTAVRAANSGHLVLSTLHSPLAAGAIQSMLAFGVNPYFLANSLLGIVAQRLVRVLNPETRKMYDVSLAPDTFAEVKRYLSNGEGNVIYGPEITDGESSDGYIGQSGLFEILHIDREIKELISGGSTASEIHDVATKKGMLDFRLAALLKTAKGVTGIEEISHVIPRIEMGA